MNLMNSLERFLRFLNDNWVAILICISCVVSIVKKTTDWLSKSEEERLEIAKAQISETILKMITEAEVEYEEWVKAGSIKRSQVIDEIYEKYPALSKIADQETLIAWIDEQIDTALDTLRKIIAENETAEEAETATE